MLIMDDPELYRRASEYHDHGHDHIGPDRGLESRSFTGFNYRMMELQGALGLAQLSKLMDMIASQKTHKTRLKKILAGIKGIRFRELVTLRETPLLSWPFPCPIRRKLGS